jgi:hypothetical protein
MRKAKVVLGQTKFGRISVMRKGFHSLAVALVWQCFSVSVLSGQDSARYGRLSEVCHVEFPARTQAGEMKSSLAICRLESERGSDDSLYVVITYDRENPPSIDRILKGAHSPIIERRGNEIILLYTQGVNTTCVTKYSIDSGVAEYKVTETIAWNDSGTYRTSQDFNQYTNLLSKRK